MLRFSANVSTLFTSLPLLERFDAAKAAGFDAVEMQFPYVVDAETLAAMCRRAAVEFVLINMPAGDFEAGERGIACLPDRRAAFSHALRLAGDYAAALGCTRVNCLAGNVPEEVPREVCRSVLVENLWNAAEAFARRGIQLMVEPLNIPDNPHFIISGTDEAIGLIDEVGHANLALQYDSYHARAMGEDPCVGLERYIARIGHIQISDFPGRGAPGTGTLDFARLFQTIKRLPYEGWVGCEYFCAAPEPGHFKWN